MPKPKFTPDAHNAVNLTESEWAAEKGKTAVSALVLFIQPDGSVDAKWAGMKLAVIGALELYLPALKNEGTFVVQANRKVELNV